jgi:hypothetical protein
MIEDICIEVDDDSPRHSLEAFESILARIAGTAVAMYRDTLEASDKEDSDDILFKPDFDGTDEDDA